MANRKRVDKWKVLALGGAVIAFLLTNYWSFDQGRKAGNSLLIDTLEKYGNFYVEVQENSERACTADFQLMGVYLARYRSMLPIIEGEIAAPYDNPCPQPPRKPKAPRGLGLGGN